MSLMPYIGEIAIYASPTPPSGWARCDGSLLQISQNPVLFQLLGTTFGGDGQTTFALPNLCGQTPIGNGTGTGLTPRRLGDAPGSESVALDEGHVPTHKHALQGVWTDPSGNSFTPDPTMVIARSVATDSTGKLLNFEIYAQDPDPIVQMDARAVGTTGGEPHPNMMPYLTLNVCIALGGQVPRPG